MSTYCYGIDFGTSNSVLAVLHKESRKIEHLISESSVIYFEDADTIFFANNATQEYIRNNMKGRLLKSIKTLLPQSSFSFTYIFGKKYTAEDLVCLLLTELKSKADALIGEDVTEVVLGRPVVFSEDPEKDRLAEKRLLKAAASAGFEKIWFQYEPIAAGFLYEQTIRQPETVLIGDFGGGTSDFTLMHLGLNTENKNRKNDILKTGGIHIGGDDFDASIMWNKLIPYFGYGIQYNNFGKLLDLPVHIFRTLCQWEQMAFLKEGNIRRSLNDYYYSAQNAPQLLWLMKLIDENLGFSLFQSIERSKINLSSTPETALTFHQSVIQIDEKINLEEFNTFIHPDIEKTDQFITSFLSEAGISGEAVQSIFLTGGTSSIPAIRELFTKRFPSSKIHQRDNFTSVAQGLALSYLYITEN